MFEGLYRSSGGAASRMRDATDLKYTNRQEILAREKKMVAAGIRPPRRALTTNDYVYPTPPPYFGRPETTPRTVLVQQNTPATGDTPPPPTIHVEAAAKVTGPSITTTALHEDVGTQQQQQQQQQQQEQQQQSQLLVPRIEVIPPQLHNQAAPQAQTHGQTQTSLRPQLGAPRRSYSVMDYEPVPPTQQPSVNLTLEDLPPELHYTIFDFLDPIDSTCLGLTNKHFYAIHRCMHGTVPLSARRAGPNDMEWVWHLAGRPAPHNLEKKPATNGSNAGSANTAATHDTETVTKALAMLRVRGQALCRKCGVRRCELHTHIQDWMGPGYEYCTVRDKFGPVAPPGAKDFCYLSNPKDPHRCGRHRVAKVRGTATRTTK